MKDSTFPMAMNKMITLIKIKDLTVVPNPIMRVRIESDMKAQIKEPPLRRPVI